jgi:hypothetical protein
MGASFYKRAGRAARIAERRRMVAADRYQILDAPVRARLSLTSHRRA